jgi:hypothetical protein
VYACLLATPLEMVSGLLGSILAAAGAAVFALIGAEKHMVLIEGWI